MKRDDLDARNWAIVRKHWRRLMDNSQEPPPGMLDDLAAVADEHAADVGATAGGREDDAPAVAPGAVDRKGPIRTGTRRRASG
jgi:hypothetical protein